MPTNSESNTNTDSGSDSGSESEYPLLPTIQINTKYIEEQIVIIYFNATRKNSSSIIELSNLYLQLLHYLKQFMINDRIIVQKYVTLLYRLIGQTRDCYSNGKGEQLVSYMMIYAFYQTFPMLAFYAIQSFVIGKYSYGSWRDVKYFCDYVRIQCKSIHHPIIQYSIRLMNKTLFEDFSSYIDMFGYDSESDSSLSRDNPVYMQYKKEKYSLVSKWIPRENKKFDWMYDQIVMDWFRYYEPTTSTSKTRTNKPTSQCKKKYRRIVSCLNQRIETLEIHLCNKKKCNIQPSSIPQVAFMKYKSLLFQTESDHSFHQQNIAMHYYLKHFPNDLNCYGDYEPSVETKYLLRVPLAYYVKEAISIYKSMREIEIETKNGAVPVMSQSILSKYDLLNLQWKQFSDSLHMKKLYQFIPMVDMSETMVGDELYTAIGISCLIAERSTLGKKVLVYDNQPTWISLDHCISGDFVSMIETIFSTTRSVTQTCSNLHSVIQLLTRSFSESNTTTRMIEVVKLVILSNQYSLFQPILLRNMFTMNKMPPPLVVFWNMSSRQVFSPIYSGSSLDSNNNSGCFFFSGESIYPLSILQKNHIASPFQVVEQIALDTRYDVLENHCNDYFSFSSRI